VKDEYLESSDKLIDGKKFQRGREKFQRGREKFKRDREGSLTDHLCSQPAHDQNVLGRCAQWETDSGRPPKGDTHEHGGTMRVVVQRAYSRITYVTLFQGNQTPRSQTEGKEKG
jgi:hypothetical protein